MASQKILIVEDEAPLLSLYETILSSADVGEAAYDVSTASSAEEATELLDGCEVDVVLSDYRLPEKDGIQLIKEVRQRTPWTQCLLISGFVDANLVRMALASGARECLKKPCSLEELFDAVAKAAQAALEVREGRAPVEETTTEEAVSKRIEEVVEANYLHTFFIDFSYNIQYANRPFREDYPRCLGEKCYEVMAGESSPCPGCQAVTSVEEKVALTSLREASAPGGEKWKVEEKVSPWFEKGGDLRGLTISLAPLLLHEKSGAKSVGEKKSILPFSDAEGRDLMLFALDRNGDFAYVDRLFADLFKEDPLKMKGMGVGKFFDAPQAESETLGEKGFLEFAKKHLSRAVRLDIRGKDLRQKRSVVVEFQVGEFFRLAGWEIMAFVRNEAELPEAVPGLESSLSIFEKELRRKGARKSDDMVITVNIRGRIMAMNSFCERRLGRSLDDLTGKRIVSILAEEKDRLSLAQAFLEISSMSGRQDLRLNLRVGGEIIRTLADIRGVRDARNRAAGYLIVLQELGDEMRSKVNLGFIENGQALGLLSSAIAEQLDSRLEVLESSAAKERGDVGGSIPEWLGPSVLSLLDLARQLRSFSFSQEAPSLLKGNVNDVIEPVLEVVRDALLEKKIRLSVDLLKEPLWADYNPSYLKQALLSLLANAMGSVGEKNGAITLSSERRGESVCLRVWHNGRDLASADAEKFLGSFLNPRTPQKSLGLSVTREIIASQKGSLQIDSSGEGSGNGKEKGFAFVILLPSKA